MSFVIVLQIICLHNPSDEDYKMYYHMRVIKGRLVHLIRTTYVRYLLRSLIWQNIEENLLTFEEYFPTGAK